MPKNTKKGGFKAAKNYVPKDGRTGGSHPGSRSAGHRGFTAGGEGVKKARWTTEDRDARRERTDRFPRDESRGERPNRPAYGRDDNRGGNPRGGFARDDRPARPERGGYGASRGKDFTPRERTDRFDRSDRPTGGYNRDERGPRTGGYNRDDRGPRTGGYNRDDRGARPERFNGFNRDGARPERDGYNRDDRGPRTGGYNRDGGRPDAARADRSAPRTENRGESTGRRYFDDRGSERNFRDYSDRAERPARTGGYNRDDRGARPERSTGFTRDDRGARPERGGYNRDDRGPRTGGYNRDDRGARPARSFDRDDRGARGGSDSKFYPNRDEKPRFTPEEDVVLERLEAQSTLAADVEGVSWQDLGLGDNIARALGELGAPSPFPIQAATIPDVIAGRDVLGRGRTGSGKTIAFGAPLVEKLMENGGGKKRELGRKPRALILAPTRELALQIDRTVQPIARSVGLFTTQIYGGVPQGRQVGALQRGVDIIVGTPGRIEDLIEQRRLDLSEVTITVLDEADHMCDLGFLEPVQRILNRTQQGGQKLLFSATLDKGVAMLVDEFLVDPSVREVAGEDQASGTIDHRVLLVDRNDKDLIIEQLADREGKTLIFSRTRAYAERMADQLEDAGIPAVSLHGDLNQARRTRNLEKLTKGRVNVLVATDVAARGIHVDDIDLVIQADPPDEYKTYMHRSGRTGRAGRTGTVLTIIPRSRQRRTKELLDRAEITADFTPFFPGDTL
ncbi:DEAD/DEAH box helicase [Klugiella xanthotipulae]|nr:DEAD/DEAH box helicase [Klugiella xanthotipulae]